MSLNKEQQAIIETLQGRYAFGTAFEIEQAWKLGKPAAYNKQNRIMHGLKGRIDRINREMKP